jgi:hypothetical protein
MLIIKAYELCLPGEGGHGLFAVSGHGLPVDFSVTSGGCPEILRIGQLSRL